MTLSTLESTGSDSAFAARVVVEGSPYIFVSSALLVSALPVESDGRIRVNGLNIDEMEIEEEVYPAQCEFESEGMTLQILEDQEDYLVTKALTQRPDGVRFLMADFGAGDATMVLDSTVGISPGDVLHLGTETVFVDSVDSSTDLTIGTRGAWDTSPPQAHYAGDGAERGPQPVYLGRPPSLIGRRVLVYFFGEGDDLTGTGTLRWRGIITLDAELDSDASFWTLHCDSLYYLFGQDLGADLGPPVVPRGIYYSDAQPLWILIGSGTTGLSDVTRSIAWSGYWETQEDFIDDLNAWFVANIDGTIDIARVRAVARDTGEWDIEFTTDAVTPNDGYFFYAHSPCDGTMEVWTSGDGTSTIGISEVRFPGSGTFRIVRTADSIQGGGQVPRGVLGRPAAVTYADRLPDEARAHLSGASSRRMYLGGSAVPALVAGCEIQWGDGETTQHDFSDFDASDRWVELSPSPFKTWTPASLPNVKLKRRYAAGGLQEFRDKLVTHAPTYANLGAMPYVTGADLEDWAEATEAERGIPAVADRLFVAYEGVSLEDLLKEEFKLRAIFPRFSISGRIGLARLRMPSQTETPDHEIGEDDILWDDETVTWQRFGDSAAINRVVYRLGYNAATEEHEGREYVVSDRKSIAEQKRTRELEIAPLSEPRTREDIAALSFDQLVRLAQPVLSVFGSPLATLRVPVIWKHFGALVGDTVSITCSVIPNVEDGTRGVVGLRGIITGRSWEIGSGRGTLTVLCALDRVVGYAPSVSIVDTNDLGGNLWALDVSTMDPLGLIPMWKTGDVLSDHLEVGQRVRARQWGTSSPATQTGEITIINDAGTITVQFDGVFTPTALAVLELAEAGNHDFGSKASRYAFLGTSDGFVAWNTGDERAEGFAP